MKRFIHFVKMQSIREDSRYTSLKDRWWNALRENDIESIKRLIDVGYDYNKERGEDTSYNPLCYSSYRGDKGIVKLLLQQPGIDITFKDNIGDFIQNVINGHSMFLSTLNDYSLQKKILENGREDIILFFDKYKLVHPKIKEENPELFKAKSWGLLPEGKSDLPLEDQMIDAIYSNNIEKVKSLIEQGIDLNIEGIDELTPLMVACRDGKLNIVKLLLDQPTIDINTIGFWCNTALMCAAKNSNIDIMRLLLERPEIDVTIKEEHGKNFIDFLIIDVRIKEVISSLIKYNLQKKILENGREDIIFFFDQYGLVHPKIKEDNPDLFKAVDWVLIHTEAKTTKPLGENLFDAIRINSSAELKDALSQGADVNYIPKHYNGWTPLIYSVYSNRNNITEILLEQPGIDVNIKDDYGETAISVSITRNNNIRIIRSLLSHPDIEVKNVDDTGKDFLSLMNNSSRKELTDHAIQLQILRNGREDILLLFDKYGLINSKIKEENPELFKAVDWGLVS